MFAYVYQLIYRGSPDSTVSLSTVPGLVRFSNSTKKYGFPGLVRFFSYFVGIFNFFQHFTIILLVIMAKV